MEKTNKSNKSFEESLSVLTDTVTDMESGSISLSASLEKFEIGMKAYQECDSFLQNMEKKVYQLTNPVKGNDKTETKNKTPLKALEDNFTLFG